MSPIRSGYKELGLELVSLEKKRYRMPKRPLMVGENKDDGIGYPFKKLLEESPTQQRNEMIDSFVQILEGLPIGDESSSRRGTAQFKVKINFDIPIFEGQIDVDVVDKFLNLLEDVFLSITFQIEKRLLLGSSNSFPMSKICGILSVRKRKQRIPHYL
jgi:hypothetical protein